jgi:lysophospholipase L1-like esterase
VTGVVAIGLEWAVAMASVVLRRWYGRIGGLGLAWRATVLVGAVVGLLIGAELIVRQVAPQESPEFGWGERLSLEPDPTFGWRLKPSQETRLRWESYDYIVTANTLGYPGPEYPMQKQPQTLRILTIGDAFTSAEGVGTAQAWPRLLEADLTAQQPDRRVEVLNFGITGYGPNQYTAVLEHFAPIYRPDLIIIGFFVNDYQDVLVSNEEFQQSIGFDLPSPDGLRAIVRLAHLRHLVRVKLIEPLAELLRGQPRSYGYFLGYFAELERNRPEFTTTGRQLVSQRLTQIKAVADQIGARVIIVMIPAPVQVCRPDQLAYYPGNVDLSDTSRFDLDLPQRMTQEITNSLAFKYYDLRPILSAAPEGCPYQPHNSHWTAAGHQIVAADLATMLKADKSLFAWETP